MGETEDVIKAGCHVIVKKQKYSKVYKVSSNGVLMLGKDEIEMQEIIGKPYWTTFEMVPLKSNKRTFKLKAIQEAESWDDLKNTLSSGADNRDITDDGTSQKLSKEEILQLQESGKSGKEIIGTLIENSKSFLAKTEYSQEKYIKKKEKKYFRYLVICKPTILSLHEVYFRQDHTRIGGLRMDALSQILSYSDIQSDGLYILYDSGSQGLPAAAMVHRIGTNTTGIVINMHPGNIPQLAIIQAMNFPKEQTDRHITVNIYSFLRLYYQKGPELLNDVSPCETVLTPTTSHLENNQISSSDDNRKQEIKVEDNIEIAKINQLTDGNANEATSKEVLDTSIYKNFQNKKEDINTFSQDTVNHHININKFQCLERKAKEEEIENKQVLKRKLDDAIETDAIKKPKWLLDTEYALDLLKGSKARGLVIVAKEHPLNIIKSLMPFLGASRPFVIFHVYREPLQETYIALKQTQNVVNLRLFSNFLRSYQVLPDRTHPDIITSDTGGYILTGYLVE